LDKFLENETRKPEDRYVNITIYHVSTSLVEACAIFIRIEDITRLQLGKGILLCFFKQF